MELPSYRGDIINDIAFTEQARRPDPRAADRGLPAVGRDAEPAARLRARRLCQPRQHPAVDARLRQGLRRKAITTRNWPIASPRRSDFMQACGLDLESHPELKSTDFYTSHEALLLGYEQAMTREDSTHPARWYCTSAHMLWIGDRTRQPDHAHVEYLPRHQESARPQMRSVDEARRTPAPDRHPQSRERAGPAHADRVGSAPRRSASQLAAAGSRGPARGQGRASGRAIRCTATPSRRTAATRPGRSTASSRRSRPSSRCIARRARMPAACIWR